MTLVAIDFLHLYTAIKSFDNLLYKFSKHKNLSKLRNNLWSVLLMFIVEKNKNWRREIHT